MYETEKELVYQAQDFLEDLPVLVKKIKQEMSKPLFKELIFDGVYGVPAGGLVLATCIHYRLDLPLLMAPTQRSLVVDDIVDSGKTMSHYIEKGNFTVSIFYKENGLWRPNIWLHKKYDKWIKFELWEGAPWEFIGIGGGDEEEN